MRPRRVGARIDLLIIDDLLLQRGRGDEAAEGAEPVGEFHMRAASTGPRR